ncbi:hypothetical protein PoB_002263000, partial [Plakobranchus ocellatus]
FCAVHESDEVLKQHCDFESYYSYAITPVSRIFGETSMSFDTDTDRMVLLSGGLQASAHDHQLKCQRLKETAEQAIKRLTHWPVCTVFEQWREFTARERQLKQSAAQLRTQCAILEEAQVFRKWRENYLGASRARNYRNRHLTQASFEALRDYRIHRQYVKNLARIARNHRLVTAGRKFFYPWAQKVSFL